MEKYYVSVIGGHKEFKDLESAELYVLDIYSSNYNNRDCSQDEEYYEMCCDLIWCEEDGVITDYRDII